jgi:hypothetical protein
MSCTPVRIITEMFWGFTEECEYTFVVNEHNPVKPPSNVSEGTVGKNNNKSGKMTVVTKF